MISANKNIGRLAFNGSDTTFSLDQRGRDRLTYCSHVAKLSLKVEANRSVVARRALAVYAAHLDGLLADNSDEAISLEASALLDESRGHTEALPIEALLAVPPRPFSAIAKEAGDTRAAKHREEIQAFLRHPLRGR